MEFRDATKDDVPAILPMLRAQYALHSGWDRAKFGVKAGFEAGYGRWLEQRAGDVRSVFLVAVVDDRGAGTGGRVVGFLIGTVEEELPLYEVREFGFVHDLWVDEGYRNEGVGRQLVTLAVEKFRAMGVTQVRCETAEANDAARGLFERCGFRPSVRVMVLDPETPQG